MIDVIGAPDATLAAATPAQAFVLAGTVRLGTRSPVLVITPTGAIADQLAHDLAAFVASGPDDEGAAAPTVEVLPAWETLPFERVSPDVATMGRRLRLLWQLGSVGGHGPGGRDEPGIGSGAPGIVVAPIRAVLQRLGPWRTAGEPVVVRKERPRRRRRPGRTSGRARLPA